MEVVDEALPPAPLRRRPDVQGLRAVAVTLVILAHLGVPWVSGGFVGVDVFFVVSGFLISSLLLHEVASTGRLRLGHFYARRARRILPAATVVLVSTCLFVASTLSLTRVSEIVQDARWAAFFAANVHFSRLGVDYFEQDRAVSPVQHFWSLAVEEQFYLFWPALLLLVVIALSRHRHRLLVLSILVSGIWSLSLLWSAVLTARSPVESYFSSATRAWELATGALLAIAGHLLPRLPRPARGLLSALGLAGITLAAVLYDQNTPFPGLRALLPVLATAALLAGGAAGEVGAGRLLAWRPLQYLGDISYSLYLWHWPVIILGAAFVGQKRSWWAACELIGVVLVLSVLSYHLVEQPVRRSRSRMLRGRLALGLWPVALASVLVSASWSGAHASAAFQERIAGHQAVRDPTRGAGTHRDPGGHGGTVTVESRLAAATRLAQARAPITFPLRNLRHLQTDSWEAHLDCYAKWDDVHQRICPRGDTHARMTVVVYGNSHAGMWALPLGALGRRDGYRVIPLVKVGCAPFDVEQLRGGGPYPQCPAFRRWALRQIAELRPDVVVLAYGGLFAGLESDPRVARKWTTGVSTAVRRISRLTRSVKVISDITNLAFAPADCITDPHSTTSSCLTREQRVTRTGNALTRRAVERLGADFVDVTGLVCVRRSCPLIVDGIVTYRDAAHLSVTWSRIVTSELGQLLHLPTPGREGPSPHPN